MILGFGDAPIGLEFTFQPLIYNITLLDQSGVVVDSIN